MPDFLESSTSLKLMKWKKYMNKQQSLGFKKHFTAQTFDRAWKKNKACKTTFYILYGIYSKKKKKTYKPGGSCQMTDEILISI